VSTAYVDTSFLLAILFAEPRGRSAQRILERFDDIVAGDLLVAEALAAAVREGVELESVLPTLESISLVLPDRTLEREMRQALEHGHLRGADLWHLACAMFVAGQARAEVAFLSRDQTQRRVARRLGFPAP
jgi:predicted nucleic acid-binding protein